MSLACQSCFFFFWLELMDNIATVSMCHQCELDTNNLVTHLQLLQTKEMCVSPLTFYFDHTTSSEHIFD